MGRALILAGFIGATLAVAACGADDGKAKLYELCNISAPCSAQLICLNGACSRSCSVINSPTTLIPGECKQSAECDDIATGCCKLTVVSGGSGKGNCTLTP